MTPEEAAFYVGDPFWEFCIKSSAQASTFLDVERDIMVALTFNRHCQVNGRKTAADLDYEHVEY